MFYDHGPTPAKPEQNAIYIPSPARVTASEPRHLGIGGIGRHIDKALMAARIVEAGGDQAPHAEPAHVAEVHRLARRLLFLCHWRI